MRKARRNDAVPGVKKTNARRLAVTGMLGAISVVLGFVPGLGFIPIGPLKVTTMHIPVIIGAVVEGPLVGMSVGLIFGIISMIQAVTSPTPLSFVFFNPLVAVLPRILIGVVSYYVYAAVKKASANETLSLLTAGALGTATNTVGVLGMIYFLYAGAVTAKLSLPPGGIETFLLGIATANGIPEMVVGAVLVAAIGKAVKKASHRKGHFVDQKAA